MNATSRKFGDPDSVVWRGNNWVVLLRPQQATLGALVLCTSTEMMSFSALSREASAEYAQVLAHSERALQTFRAYDKINFLTLMMVDPHVHTHILPRYANAQTYGGITFQDAGWPTLPDLKSNPDLPSHARASILADLQSAFAKTAHVQHA